MTSEHPFPWLLPASALMVIFGLYPLLYAIWLSLQRKHPVTRKLVFNPTYNWAKMFGDERVWNALTVDPNQWLHCGPSGAGHFGKTIHDATATTMRQAVSEGVALLAGKREFDFDTGALAECWRHAGGVQSNALDVIATQLRQGRAPNAASIVTPADAAQIERAVIESARQRSATPTIAAAAMLHFGRSEK